LQLLIFAGNQKLPASKGLWLVENIFQFHSKKNTQNKKVCLPEPIPG
jgi:hypothetical protein